MKIIIFTSIGIVIFGVLWACTGSKKSKVLKTKKCNEKFELLLCEEKIMKELSYQKEYHLYLKNLETQQTKKITGNNAIAPHIKRYLDMVVINDFGKDINVFTSHYVHPSVFSREEYDMIIKNYTEVRNEWTEIHKSIARLIYGNTLDFHEVFKCPDGKFFLTTDIDGGISIVEDSSYYAKTIPLEKRKANVIGIFDNNNELHFTKGKLLPGVFKGFYDREVKRIEIIDSTKNNFLERELIWADILYNEKEYAINEEYLLNSENNQGIKLKDIFKISTQKE